MHRYLQMALLGAALVVPISLSAQDHDRDRVNTPPRYQDRAHHDWHEWNENEDHAYRHWLEEHHRAYHDFAKASRREQEDYWKWRHAHPDGR